MKTIFLIIKYLRNNLPYFILITIYFFFINLEARKENNDKFKLEKHNNNTDNKSRIIQKNLRLKIPVIEYKP